MRVIKAKVSNFGSFKELDFDFQDGLTLISGPTGSGKSTILDIVSWVLYGQTSKNGSVDDVRSWGAKEATTGVVEVELPDGIIKITRIRGTSAKQNDLYWEDEHLQHRGKDVTETTKLLEKRLGVSSNLYHSRAIYNDSSISGRFFTAKAKERKQLLEQVANLDFPVKLSDKLKADLKSTKKESERIEQEYKITTAKREQLEQLLESTRIRSQDFDKDKLAQVYNLDSKAIEFESDNVKHMTYLRARIAELEPKSHADTCTQCGHEKVDREVVAALARAKQDLDFRGYRPNQFLSELERVKASVNPHFKAIDNLTFKLELLEDQHLYVQMTTLSELVISMEKLQDLTNTMRGLLLENVTHSIQDATNAYLEKHFDSEIRIELKVASSDDLEVTILKGGHTCPYAQLSKGQKSLLKLCFALSVGSAAANRSGVHIDTLMLDEPTDGFDTALKTKAFGLLQDLSLEHKSVYVIEHTPEFQGLFHNKIKVEMIGDYSHVQNE